MKKTIKAKNIVLTDAISEYLDKRLSAIGKYVDMKDDSVILDVEVGKTSNHHKSGDIFRVEVNLHMKKTHLRAESEKSDLYVAIDDVKDEIVAELRSHKTKRMDIVRRGGHKLKALIRGLARKNAESVSEQSE